MGGSDAGQCGTTDRTQHDAHADTRTMSKKAEPPCVLGDSLARGLTNKIARDFTKAFSADNFVPSLMVGRRTRLSVLNHTVSEYARQSGPGLMKRIESGEGKKKVITLITAALAEGGHMTFEHLTFSAKTPTAAPEQSYYPDAIILNHAIQRAVQNLKTTDLKTLGLEFYAHAKQTVGVNIGHEAYYTMTNKGLAIWSQYSEDDDSLVCRTFIGADVLDGKNAIRRQRWLDGLDYQ